MLLRSPIEILAWTSSFGSVIINVMAGVFLARFGAKLHREKNAVSVFALGLFLITFAAVKFTLAMAQSWKLPMALTADSGDYRTWVTIFQTLNLLNSLLIVAAMVLFARLIARNLAQHDAPRRRCRESLPLVVIGVLAPITFQFAL